MVTSHSSYLQTLDKKEATAFVASLQKIKEHLSSELEWITSQVQQKTTQLQGIETILAEAVELGLTDSSAATAPSDSAAEISTASITESTSSDDNGLPSPAELLASTPSNGDVPPSLPEAVLEAVLPTVGAAPESAPEKTTSSKRGAKKQASSAKSKQAAKSSKPPRVSSRAKKPSKSAPSKASDNQAEGADLRQYLQSDFRDKSLTDSVAEILNDSREPLSVSDVMTELYDGLSGDRYKRAKNSITNVLSVGRSKGKWKSTGRGMYANNSVATA